MNLKKLKKYITSSRMKLMKKNMQQQIVTGASVVKIRVTTVMGTELLSVQNVTERVKYRMMVKM